MEGSHVLTYAELIELERSLRRAKVLSVYLDGTSPDPATRYAWRLRLDNALRDIEGTLESAPRDEREAFARSAMLLRERLAPMPGALGAPGWAAFVTAGEVRHAGALNVSAPFLVTWETGARVAPYVCALTQQGPVIVAIVDTREARLFRYRGGVLEKVDTLRAQAVVGPSYHMGDAPRDRFHPGTRGTTGTDAAERALRAGTDRMLAELAERLKEIAGKNASIVIGGTPQAAIAAEAALPNGLASRALRVPTLDVRATDAEIRDRAEEAVAALRESRQAALVAEVLERYGADGLGAAGAQATWRALDARTVQELLLTGRFVKEHAEEAETAVHAAFDQGALVEALAGAAAERLDRDGAGIAARLRFLLPSALGGPTTAEREARG